MTWNFIGCGDLVRFGKSDIEMKNKEDAIFEQRAY